VPRSLGLNGTFRTVATQTPSPDKFISEGRDTVSLTFAILSVISDINNVILTTSS
jgi:hypothetical protein